MRALFILLTIQASFLFAQPKKVTASVEVSGQEKLELDFAFADQITFTTWEKKEVLVEVSVEINEGEDNDIFSLSSRKGSTTISIEMDEDMWKKLSKRDDSKWNNCNYTHTINYKVFLPKGLEVHASTITGDYEFQYQGLEMHLETISGAIDVTIMESDGMDFKAETITGEIFSDLEIAFPEGKKGLRQVVGQDIWGRIGSGGIQSHFESISGNIYLRKG